MSVCKNRTVVQQDRTEIAGRIVAYLREIYPTKTAEHVAADVGVTVYAVEKWLSRESAPSLSAFGIMSMIYGPEFVSRAFPKMSWLDPVVRAEKVRKLNSEIAERERQLAQLRG
jgi:molybdopterin converting factor small subunit